MCADAALSLATIYSHTHPTLAAIESVTKQVHLLADAEAVAAAFAGAGYVFSGRPPELLAYPGQARRGIRLQNACASHPSFLPRLQAYACICMQQIGVWTLRIPSQAVSDCRETLT